MATYINPNAIKDASIEGIKIKDGTISSSKIDGTVASKNYVDALEAKVTNAVQITYAELKALRDAGKLVPGTQYRITDYQCTTIQENTRSAGHQFDIIVTADDESTLNEVARVALHSGDEYFSGCNLSAWKIWYCLDNDTERFAWADTVNGKGVIYWMKDEYDNECPYDFKNIQFKRYAVTNVTSTKLTSDALNKLKNILVKDSNGGLYFATKNSYGNFVPSNANGTSYEINENDSNWYYTFQGISSADGSTINKMYDLTVETFKLTDECISYLEGDGSGADTEDYCRENKIEQFNQEYFADDIYYKGRQILNNIVFIGGLNYCYQDEESYWTYNTSSIYGNRFGVNCNSNTFGNSFQANTFGNNCWNNTFGNIFQANTFGNNCWNNTFGNNCWNNTFGDNCSYNTFGNDCEGNTFGNNCFENTFGNECEYNTFGNNYYRNAFGRGCQHNIFGNFCYSNTFENDFHNNTFGNYCGGNTFGNNCYSNTFGNNCFYIKFASDASATTKYNYYQHNHFGDGCQYILFTGEETESISEQVQNYNFAQGLQGTRNAYLTIDGKRNRAYETYISKDTDGAIKESVIAEKLDKVIEISYNDLVTLRGSSKLVPGQQYRITDYTCTTSQEGTRSAGHQFDIIVTADSKNKLNEEARAINHKFDNPDDDYFKDCNLSAWKIWYCLDNDFERFAWAFFAELIGTIKPTTGGTYTYNSPISNIVVNGTIYTLEIGVRTQISIGPPAYVTKTDDYTLVVEDTNGIATRNGISVYTDSQEGKGVIYRMIDEFGNDCPYDFKNIQFYRQWDATKSLWSTISSDNTGVPCYTFSSEGNSSTTSFTDMSLASSNNIYSNVIKNYIKIDKQTLNNNCFFGKYCARNTFGNNCYENIFGNYCYDNSFGNEYWNNTFGNECYRNTFGNECYRNTFGNNCYHNTFVNKCSYNTFVNKCSYNTFGNSCNRNTFGNYIQESQFGDGVQYFSITTQQMTTNPTSSYLKNYIRWLIVENGVRYVNAYVTGTTSDTSYCQNVRICLGVQGNYSNRKTFDITSCINSKLNNVYQPTNSQTTSV